ncbi:GntR family transcriptional regulator [soil metagenome]
MPPPIPLTPARDLARGLARETGRAATPSFSPLYEQIKALILQSLQGGEWKPGEAIPSEIELAARYKVSQGTVRKAVDALAGDNFLVRRQGKGTYVSTHAAEHVQFRFLRLTPDQGENSDMTRHFIDCKRVRAPAEVARSLELKAGEATIQARRILSFHGRPVVVEDIWLPGQLFKGLTTERLSAHTGPTYSLFESEFGVRIVRAQEKVRAVLADESAADVLGLEVGAPLLNVERLTRTFEDRPVELRKGLWDTTSHHYRNDLG